MGHAKEIITIDVYGDNQEIIEDCLEVLEPFIDEVMSEEKEEFDLTTMDYMDSVASELVVQIVKFLCERYRGTCDLYIFYANCGILFLYALMNSSNCFRAC